MMRATVVVIVVCLLIIGANSAQMQTNNPADAPPVIVLDTETLALTSAFTDHDFRISVALPVSYATSTQTYPVLYVLDPQVTFLSATEFVRFMAWGGQLPEMIVVGVGYPTDDVSEISRLRQTDYYISQAEFLQFLSSELFPLIESRYRIDSADRALVGYSYGGEFAYHVLVNSPELFKRYIVIDAPATQLMSYLMRNDEAFWSQFAALDVKLFTSVRGEETLSAALQARDYAGLEASGLSLGDVTHEAALYLSLPRGIMAVYAE